MPRAPVAGREIRRRSRNGCWNCKARKVKCGEEKPRCSNCERLDEDCDYKIRLSWGGRPLKKKQLENGGNGQDLNADDQSQFIPGAGHFSLNPHFPAPQTFLQANHANGTTRKPPIPRAGNGKKTTMSNYQTVFSVSEPPAAPPPSLQTSTAAPVDPQLTAAAPPQVRSPQTPVVAQYQQRTGQYGWQPSASTPSSVSTLDHEDAYRGDQQQPYYSPFTPVSMPFDHAITSPTNNYPAASVRSPPGAPSAPHTPYTQSHPQHQHKTFHPPPPINTSPSKRLRTSTSPTQPPPNSPFIYDAANLATSLPPHATSLGTALDYMAAAPITAAPMAHMAELHAVMDHPAVSGVGMGTNTIMRRVSVENLLAPPLPSSLPDGYAYVDRYPQEMDIYKREGSPASSNMHFGVDNGEPDLDNDDDVEEIPRDNFGEYAIGHHHHHHHHHHHLLGSNLQNMPSMPSRSFYTTPTYPVPITIPRKLDPLPELLLGSQKNLMYFHHYLHYTARLLVPHDCSENPFKSVLPQMAVETDHLMNLLLAYSASHRARLLGHAEPTERISRFIDETVRSLQVSLNHPDQGKSDATLATAIMLSSYQIISPTPFDLPGLTWQTHLSAARKIIMARGGISGMQSRDKVSYFLVRWFAYLDLLGSLSGRDTDEPLFSGKYWTNDDGDESGEYSVDCFFGFTSRCVSILAKIGELARRCERERKLDMENSTRLLDMNGQIMQDQYDDWKPTPEIQEQAMALLQDLEEARGKAIGQCHHNHDGYSHSGDSELMATNDAFHWAALVHLYRRVLNYPTDHQRVQYTVGQIVRLMSKVPRGGTAENCLLFPLFSAGCEALGEDHREYTLKRLMEVEKSGLTQVRSARLLMQRVWEEGRPWWEMADGEFIG